jgi:putative transcriptional regulator
MPVVRTTLESARRKAKKFDWSRFDATTEADIARHIAEDEAEASRDAAKWVRGVRRRVGLSQNQFAARIGVSVATLRNWEQGKRFPRGPARALLRIIDHAPEAAMLGLAR